MAKAAVPTELIVLLHGRVAGVLGRDRTTGSPLLAYVDNWRDDPNAFPLSLSLPLASQFHDGPRVAHYLRGLLPDNEPHLNAIAHQCGVAADDSFALLSHIGEDCPGAVQFVRADRVAEVQGEGPGTVEWLSDNQVAEVIRDLQKENRSQPAEITGRFTLPGATPKAALTWNPETHRWGRPTGRAATTHIIKPPLHGVKFHNENEHMCLALARRVGFPAAASSFIRVADQHALAVERYDREWRNQGIHRLHQEDLSQALGVNPRLKYAAEGAPEVSHVVMLLREQTSRGLQDVYRFLRALVFNWAIGNTDAHPRNYSVLVGSRGDVTLSPLYDISSGILLPSRSDPASVPFAMAVAGRRTLGSITHAVWEEQAKELKLNSGRVMNEIDDLLAQIGDEAPLVAETVTNDGVDELFAARFAARLTSRVASCRKELGREGTVHGSFDARD